MNYTGKSILVMVKIFRRSVDTVGTVCDAIVVQPVAGKTKSVLTHLSPAGQGCSSSSNICV